MANTREITYYDVSPYAALSARGEILSGGGQIQDFSDLRKLFAENITYRSIQTCEHNYMILDGEHKEFSETGEDIAAWSIEQSLYLSRMLPQSVKLDISFGGLQSGPGIAFYFDIKNNIWCDMLRVKWHRDNNLLSDRTFYPDSPAYSCENKVDLYNRVEIEFMRMNMPRRYLKLEAALFGLVRVFGDGDLENITINEGFDPTGRTLYINSANFTVNTKDELPYIFLKRQPLHIRYFCEQSSEWLYMGSYYIDKSKKFADGKYSVETVDKIGVLDASDDFMGGIYDGANITTAEELIDKIVNSRSFSQGQAQEKIFDIETDESLKNIRIRGWLPVMKRREALAQVALAIGAVIDDSRANCIKVRPADSVSGEIKYIGKDRVYQSGSVNIEFPCTAIELTEHNFTVSAKTKELYNDAFAGEKLVKFSEPASNLTITNGTIISSGANYALISSANALVKCVLSGREYIDSKSSVIVRASDSDVLEGTQEKTEKIENFYLVNKDNSESVARRLYEYYIRRHVFDGDFLAGGEQTGDAVRIPAASDDGISGQIEKLALSLGRRNIKARGIIRGD